MFLKPLTYSILIFSLFFTIAAPVLAAADNTFGAKAVANSAGGVLPQGGSVEAKVGSIVGALLGLVGIVFFGLMLYGGIMWMIAMGNTDKVEKAKQTMIAASIGIVIVLAAYAITRFVFTEVAGGGGGNATQGNCCCNNDRFVCESDTMPCNSETQEWVPKADCG